MQRPYRIGFYDNFSPYSKKLGDNNYSGIFYNIWEETKKRHNLNAEEVFIDNARFENDIDEMVEQNKYDALFIPSFVTKERIHKVNFTRPILLNKIAIAYKPNTSMFSSFFSILFSTVLPPISILLLLGITFGYILYLVEPVRGKGRAIFSSIASMFGEMGFVSENSTLSWSGMAVAFFIMFISFYFTIFLQAATVDKFSESVSSYELTKDNLSGKRIVTTKGSSYVDILKRYGAIPIERKNVKESVKTYMDSLETENSYDGFLFDYETTYKQANKHGLVLTKDNLGHNEIAFPITKHNTRLLDMINETIVFLQDKDEMKKICKKYMNEERAEYCDI
jgi:ABC-type amino acid transport substrate-binding protein